MAPAPQAVGDGAPMPHTLPAVGPALADAASPTGRLPGVLIALVAVGFFMQALDATIVNTALPALAHAFGESPLRMQSVVISYVLTVAVLVPASGYMADRFGTRPVFVAAITLFTLGSWGCASAQSLAWLVTARVFQGIGGAMLLPVGRLVVLKAVPRRDFLRAMSLIAIPGMMGPLLGPTLGGWLTEYASWRWIFFINLPVGVVAALVALKKMPDFREPAATRAHFDAWGFGLVAGAMLTLTLGLEALARSDASRPGAALLSVAGLVLMTSYFIHATRVARPLFQLDLFKVHSFSVGVSGNLFARLGMGGMPMLLPLMMQVGFGLSAVESGLSLLPMALAGLFARQPVNRLIGRFGYQRVLVLNTVTLGLLMAAFATLGAATPHPLRLVLLVLFGSANAIQYTAMNALTLKDLEGPQMSSGNGLLSMVIAGSRWRSAWPWRRRCCMPSATAKAEARGSRRCRPSMKPSSVWGR